MRILVVSPMLPSAAISMRGLTSSEQFRMFRELGHDVRAVAPIAWAPPGAPRASWQRRRAIPPEELDQGTAIAHPRFVSLGNAGRARLLHGFQRSLYWRGLKREIERFVACGGDIVHIHSCGLPGVLADHVAPAKLVVSMHDDELFDTAPAFPAVRKSIRNTLRAADAVVYVSKTLYDLGLKLAGPHNGCVIPIGIGEYKGIRPLPDPTFTVVAVSRLIARKNIDQLISAFAKFRATSKHGKLIIVGDGPMRQELESCANACGVVSSVEFVGSVPHRRALQIISRSHLFVLPSIREALGAVYFEAMAMRVPVVGVRGEGISDYVTDGIDGFLINPNDASAITAIIRAMYEDPDRRHALGLAGQRLFEKSKVRWRDYVVAHLRLYKDLIE